MLRNTLVIGQLTPMGLGEVTDGGTFYVSPWFSSSYSVDNMWSDWKVELHNKLFVSSDGRNITIYPSSNHPSEFIFHFVVSSAIKREGNWSVFNGYCEYFVTDEKPDIRTILLSGNLVNPHLHNVSQGQTPCVKRKVAATIKMQRTTQTKEILDGYSKWGKARTHIGAAKHIYTFNVFFENVGFGLTYDYVRN